MFGRTLREFRKWHKNGTSVKWREVRLYACNRRLRGRNADIAARPILSPNGPRIAKALKFHWSRRLNEANPFALLLGSLVLSCHALAVEFSMRWVCRTNRRWSTWLALAAMTLQLVLSFGHIHLEKLASGSVIASVKTSKAPSSQQNPDSASRQRGRRFLRDLRDDPSHLVVVPAGCAALAGAVHAPEQSSILAISLSFLSRRNVRHFNRARLRSPDSRSLLI